MLYQIGLLVIGSIVVTPSLGVIEFSKALMGVKRVQYYVNRIYTTNGQIQVIRDQLLRDKETEAGTELSNIQKYELCIKACVDERQAFLKREAGKVNCVAINVTPTRNVCRLLQEGIKDGIDNGKSIVPNRGDPECAHIYIGEKRIRKSK